MELDPAAAAVETETRCMRAHVGSSGTCGQDFV